MPSLPHTATVADALAWAVDALREAGVPGPRTEAEWLLAGILSTGRSDLVLNGRRVLTPTQQARFSAAVGQRRRRMPLQQVLGETEFFSLPFKITPQILIPRPETEVLVEVLIDRLGNRRCPRILDVGTGSGAIAVALAHTLPTCRVIASDVSMEALRIARENARLNGVAGRIACVRGDLLSPCRARPTFSAVVSNPPYIPSRDQPHLQPEVRDFEPRLALDGGSDGLRFYPSLVSQAFAVLLPGGWLALEVGDGQADRVASLISRHAGFGRPEIVRDLSGIRRILLACKRA